MEISELARDHAERRLNRKRRNAELRARGIDLDGPDGAVYRHAFEEACRSLQMGAFAADMSRGANITYLWQVSADQHAAWIESGFGDMPHAEYLERIRTVKNEIESIGGAVRLIAPTVAEVLNTIEELGLKNDPQGRAAAVGWLGMNT